MTVEDALPEEGNISSLMESVMSGNVTLTPSGAGAGGGGGGGGGAPVQTTPLYIYVTVSVFYGLIFVLGVVGKSPAFLLSSTFRDIMACPH